MGLWIGGFRLRRLERLQFRVGVRMRFPSLKCFFSGVKVQGYDSKVAMQLFSTLS